MPIVANSVSLGRTLQALRSRYKASLSVLDALGLAVFLIGSRGQIIEKNYEAQKILDADDGISMSREGKLKLIDTNKTKELEELIISSNDVSRLEKINRNKNIMSSPRKSNSYDYLISSYSLIDTKNEIEKDLNCAFVTIVDTDNNNISSSGIATLGQLTDAETGVVDLLIRGLKPKDVAEMRSVSLNTVKTQLKTIVQKLRCSTQSDIIRIAAITGLPIS